MAARSAGILMHKRENGAIHVLLVHPGGPFWRNKDLGAWSVPKGEVEPGEDPRAVALREFEEETGVRPEGELVPLGEASRSRKTVLAFALAGDLDPGAITSNLFEMEWPPRSGRMASFPEIDKAEWFELAQAREKIIPGQRVLLDRLAALLGRGER
jgi:predicted NUDIX family NTP pyrophosphohydrolase